MNRLSKMGIVPNLPPVVKFIGGPWDGMQLRWAGGSCPEFLEMKNTKDNDGPPHIYQLWVFTDMKNVTHTTYKHRGPQTEKNRQKLGDMPTNEDTG